MTTEGGGRSMSSGMVGAANETGPADVLGARGTELSTAAGG